MDHHDLKNMRTMDDRGCVQTHDVVVDVGACNGTYTEYFSKKLIGTGTIYCVELSPHNFERLTHRFGGQGNIIGVNAAVSDVNDKLEFYKGDSPEQFNIVGHDTSYKSQETCGSISCVTLDTLLRGEEKIKVIKIDVEGAELKVLRGMKETASKTDFVLLENHFDEDWPEIREILIEDYGFSCYDIEREEEVTIDSPRPYQCLCKRKI